jgi:hypothetical protein
VRDSLRLSPSRSLPKLHPKSFFSFPRQADESCLFFFKPDESPPPSMSPFPMSYCSVLCSYTSVPATMTLCHASVIFLELPIPSSPLCSELPIPSTPTNSCHTWPFRPVPHLCLCHGSLELSHRCPFAKSPPLDATRASRPDLGMPSTITKRPVAPSCPMRTPPPPLPPSPSAQLSVAITVPMHAGAVPPDLQRRT